MQRYEIAIEYADGLRGIQVIEAATLEIAQAYAAELADGWPFTVQRIS